MHISRLKIFGLILLMISLTACHPKPVPLFVVSRSFHSDFYAPGIQVMRQGELVKIVIFTDYYFQPGTSELKSARAATIRSLALFVRDYAHHFPHASIQVVGYTDASQLPPNATIKSNAYAQVIASYLWNAGISSYQIEAIAAGANDPIASNTYPQGSAMNRRVEIYIHF